MAEIMRQVMTPNPVVMPATASIQAAASTMRQRDIGDVIVSYGDQLCGLVTDRDLVVRALADGKGDAKLEEVCSHKLVTLSPDDAVADAIQVMSEQAIRRVPIVEDGRAVGMVSLGDLARDRDPGSVLGEISAAPPNS